MQIILLEHFPIGTESLESLYNQSSSLQQYTLVCVCVCVFVCGFPGGTVIKNPPANAGESRDVVQSLGQEDPLE